MTEAVEIAGTKVRIAYGGPIDGFTDIEEVVAAGSPDEPADEVSGKSMLYTSGTSGRPKGVESTLQQVGGDPVENLGKLELLLSLYRLTGLEGKVVLCNAPLYHGGPLAMCGVPFFLGATIIMRRKWNGEETLRLIDQYGVNIYYAVPTHFTQAARSCRRTPSIVLRRRPRVRDAHRGALPARCEAADDRLVGAGADGALRGQRGGRHRKIVDSQEWLQKPGTVGKPTPVAELLIIGEHRDSSARRSRRSTSRV